MLEIIALYFLTRQNADLAEQKGEPRRRWQIRTILGFLGMEFLGVAFGDVFLGREKLFFVLLLGLLMGFGGYLLVRYLLEQMPDQPNDSI